MPHSYEYRELAAVGEESKLNVIGAVVRYTIYDDTVNQIQRSSSAPGLQHKLTVQLVDASVCKARDDYSKAVVVNLFADDQSKLPVLRSLGDILRLHRISGRKRDNEIVLSGHIGVRGCHAVVWSSTFSNPSDKYKVQSVTSKDCTIEDQDRKMIDALRGWFRALPTSVNMGKLGGLSKGCYGDFVLLVIGRIKMTSGIIVLRVWDGSRHDNHDQIVRVKDGEINEGESHLDEVLMGQTSLDNTSCDIFMYDTEWRQLALKIQAQDIISVKNLHLWFKGPTWAFALHGKTNPEYIRELKKLTADDEGFRDLDKLRRERFGEVEWRAGETQAVDDGLEPVAIAASSQATSAEENGRHRFANRSPTAGPSSAVEDDGRHSASNSTEDASFECFVQNYEALDSSPAETSTSRPSPPVTRSASKRSKNSDDVGAAKSKRRKK